MITIGIYEETAAAILDLMMLLSLPGCIVFGTLDDFFSKRLLLTAVMLTQVLGVLVFAYASNLIHVPAFLVFVLLALLSALFFYLVKGEF